MSDTPKTDAAAFDAAQVPADGAIECVPVDFARAQERSISELLDIVSRCELWLSTIPEGKIMRDVCRTVIMKYYPKVQP